MGLAPAPQLLCQVVVRRAPDIRRQARGGLLRASKAGSKEPRNSGSGLLLSCLSLRQKHSFGASPRPAVQQQKLLSSPRFGALKDNIPMCITFRRSVFFTDTGIIIVITIVMSSGAAARSEAAAPSPEQASAPDATVGADSNSCWVVLLV